MPLKLTDRARVMIYSRIAPHTEKYYDTLTGVFLSSSDFLDMAFDPEVRKYAENPHRYFNIDAKVMMTHSVLRTPLIPSEEAKELLTLFNCNLALVLDNDKEKYGSVMNLRCMSRSGSVFLPPQPTEGFYNEEVASKVAHESLELFLSSIVTGETVRSITARCDTYDELMFRIPALKQCLPNEGMSDEEASNLAGIELEVLKTKSGKRRYQPVINRVKDAYLELINNPRTPNNLKAMTPAGRRALTITNSVITASTVLKSSGAYEEKQHQPDVYKLSLGDILQPITMKPLVT